MSLKAAQQLALVHSRSAMLAASDCSGGKVLCSPVQVDEQRLEKNVRRGG